VLAALPFVVVVQERNKEEEVRVEEIEAAFSSRKENVWVLYWMCWKNVRRGF
jgi:hypothetical protein